MRKSAAHHAAPALAKHSSSPPARLQLLYFGMRTLYSALPLAALLEAGEQVAAVIMPGRRETGTSTDAVSDNPAPTISQLAATRGIPLLTGDDVAVEQLATFKPDLAIVAGFPKRIAPDWLAIPRHGFLNCHPALLPHYRGPTPLFWALRAGETVTGVTLHFMDEHFDTGDIVYQEQVMLVEGASGREHTERLAEVAAVLVCRAVQTLRETGELPHRPQPPGGHYQSFPGQDSFQISTEWPARRAFNFMRGTAGWGRPYMIRAGGLLRLTAYEAFRYEPERVLGAPVLRRGSESLVQFSPGVLHVRA